MKVEEHTHLVGSIVLNLQALETTLRYYLLRLNEEELSFPKVGDKDAIKNYLTNYVSLGDCISKYNTSLRAEEKEFILEDDVVLIRDSIAHGRLLTAGQSFPARLWKFGRPRKDGRVDVEFCEELSVEWLTAKRNLIYGLKERVLHCFKMRGYKGLGD